MQIYKGTYEGDIAEINFVKKFNKNKFSDDFSVYIKDCKTKNFENCFMVRVTTKQYSKLSEQCVMTRADSYLIETKDEAIKTLLFNNDYYLDETMLLDNKIEHVYFEKSGVSIKMIDSDNFQILKLTPKSFYNLFGEYELGAGASIYCSSEEQISKNENVFLGWNTCKENVINKYKNDLPELIYLNQELKEVDKINIYKNLKEFSNSRIKEIVKNSKKIQEIIFNGYHIYEEPYTATYLSKGYKIHKLNYIPFYVTTGSGRSHGQFTIVFKPKNETN